MKLVFRGNQAYRLLITLLQCFWCFVFNLVFIVYAHRPCHRASLRRDFLYSTQQGVRANYRGQGQMDDLQRFVSGSLFFWPSCSASPAFSSLCLIASW